MRKLLSLCTACMMLFGAQLQAEEQLFDRVIAIVSNDVITQAQLDELKQKIERNARKTGQTLPPAEELEEQMFERLIQESLQLQLADRLGFQISDSQLENTIDNIVASEEKTRDELLAELEADGITYNQFREDVRTEVLLGELSRSQVRRRVNVSEPEIDALVEMLQEEGRDTVRYHVGHILLRIDGNESAVEQRAKQLVADLQDGKDFRQLAMANSQGPKALQGGDWGWLSIEEMPTLFAGVVENQHSGSILGPFKSNAGMHIIQVLDTEGLEKIETLEVNARHILVKPSIILSDAKAESLLNELRQQIIDGDKSFAELAREYSEDPGSAVKGGELGWSDPRVFVPAFQEAVKNYQPGEVSKPFRSTFGWHILEVLEKRTTDTTHEAGRNRAYQMLFNRKFAEETQAWLDELREEAYIEILDNAA